MTRTLLGIDLDESPVGGLVERLLSDEELEKLADGGRAPGDADAGGDDADADDVGTDLVDDAVGDDDSEPSTVPVGEGTDGASSAAASPSPGDSVDRRDPVPSPGAEDAADDEDGWRGKLRSVLPKVAVGLVVLAVVALVAYRYLGKAKSVASDKLGSDDESGSPPPTGTADAGAGEAPEARRRAKAARRESGEEFGDQPVTESVRRIEDAAGEGGEGEEPDAEGEGSESDDTEPDSVGRSSADSDVGALVGLAALAVVAAAVRKFGQERPRDPLVDGPADDSDDE